jgi:hypothetical protein
LTRAQRETVLSAAFALWGLAIGIALLTVWDRPAPPDQLPGVATALNFDAHGPFRWIAGLMLLPIVLPFALRSIAQRLAAGAAWSGNAVIAATLLTLWMTSQSRNVFWTIVPVALVIATATLLRHRTLAFTRYDTVLLPTLLTTYLAMNDALPSLSGHGRVAIALLFVLALRIVIALIPAPILPAFAFVAAPLALILQTGFFGREERYFGWDALALVTITPFVLRFVLRDARRAATILAFVIYPLALYSYSNALSLATAEGKPRINFFEDGHALLPASEYLRGERPYRDTQPAHGLIEDGGFDVIAMQLGGVHVGAAVKARAVVGNCVTVALYFVAFAATGSAEAAFFAVMLSILTGALRTSIRFLAPLIALAFLCAAVRLRRPRWFAYAAFATVICGLVSLDFAAYTFLTLIVAGVRMRSSVRPAVIGLAAGTIPLFLTLALFGILDDFFRVTFIETLAASSAYTLTFFTPTAALAELRAFPDVLAALLHRDTFPYLFWCAAAVFTGVTVTRRASRRLEPLILLGVWTTATAVSYAERHHLYFGMIAAVMAMYVVLRLLRTQRAMAFVVIAALIVLAAPSTHLGVIGAMRQARGPTDPRWVEVKELPRARGALFHEADARTIAAARQYVERSLAPDETFLDFTNSGLLYFLLGRDNPIREYEVAFYESQEAQREVIRRLESNPKVRAVLLPVTPQARFTVDGIPNADRAPLVWHYIRTNFSPDFHEGDVVFWRRN